MVKCVPELKFVRWTNVRKDPKDEEQCNQKVPEDEKQRKHVLETGETWCEQNMEKSSLVHGPEHDTDQEA